MKEGSIKKIVIIAIVLIIVSFFAGKYYNEYSIKKEQKLINQGVILTAQQISQSGNIPIISDNSIQWIPIKNLNICQGQDEN